MPPPTRPPTIAPPAAPISAPSAVRPWLLLPMMPPISAPEPPPMRAPFPALELHPATAAHNAPIVNVFTVFEVITSLIAAEIEPPHYIQGNSEMHKSETAYAQ